MDELTRRQVITATPAAAAAAVLPVAAPEPFDVIEFWEASEAWRQGWNNSKAARKSTPEPQALITSERCRPDRLFPEYFCRAVRG